MTESSDVPVLRTSRLVLTPLEVSDATDMVEVLADARIYEYIGGTPDTLDSLTRRYERQVVGHNADNSELWFNWIVRTSDDLVAIGYVQATVVLSTSLVQIAWVIAPLLQGQGFATEAVRGMLEWLHGQGYGHIVAYINPEHDASMRVAQRVGMHLTTSTFEGEVLWELTDPS